MVRVRVRAGVRVRVRVSVRVRVRVRVRVSTVLGLGLVAREEVGVTGGQVLERRLVRSLVIPPRARGPLAITPVVTRP